MRAVIAMFSAELGCETSMPKDTVTARASRLAVPEAYGRSLAQAGCGAALLPVDPTEDIAQTLSRFDGVLLCGGPDVEPHTYHQTHHPKLGTTSPRADERELRLIRAAEDLGMPILGICRGMQTMCVSRGGTLHQHIDGHNLERSARIEVRVKRGSSLAHILKTTRPMCNSIHHQAVAEPGRDVEIIARAEDGTVEAITDPKLPFWLGVQWHPEHQPEHLALFEALADAAAQWRHRGAARDSI